MRKSNQQAKGGKVGQSAKRGTRLLRRSELKKIEVEKTKRRVSDRRKFIQNFRIHLQLNYENVYTLTPF